MLQVLSLLNTYCFQRVLQHGPFLFLWIILQLHVGQQQLINLTSVFTALFFECFSAIFKNTAHAFYTQKRPCKSGRNVCMGKNVPPKRDPGFIKMGSLLGGRIYFQINGFLLFNRIRSQGEISFNPGAQFPGRVQQIIFHSSTISYTEFQNNVREILNNFCF